VVGLGGTISGTYAEAAFFSKNFSMAFQHFYRPEASYVFSGIPGNGMPADVVIGQPSFSTNASGNSLSAMNSPIGVTVVNGKLLVADNANNRLLVWSSIPTVSGTSASYAWNTVANTAFSLPSTFNTASLSPRVLSAYQGIIYIGFMDRVLVIPDIF
jgi:hypothetical protein